MSEEQPLHGGVITSGVLRVGDTVRRPAAPNPLVRDVLLHLERAGFEAAPRWLGVDEQGRDVLSWIEGDTFADRGGLHPYLGEPATRVSFSAEQVAAVMRLLRRYHDTFDGDVVCHGDVGPWNVVWRDRLPVALIDFDNARRGDPADDVAYTLRTFVGYGLADAEPDELVRLTRVALEGYGRAFEVPRILGLEYERAEERCRRNGWHRQLAKLPAERTWLDENRDRYS